MKNEKTVLRAIIVFLFDLLFLFTIQFIEIKKNGYIPMLIINIFLIYSIIQGYRLEKLEKHKND